MLQPARLFRSFSWNIGSTLSAFLLALVVGSSTTRADDPQPMAPKTLTVRDVSFFVQSRNENVLNFTQHFASGLPIGVLSNRPVRVAKLGDQGGIRQSQPLGIITFEGAESQDCEASLQLLNGSHIAHLPPADVRSTRILWASINLVHTPDATQTSKIPAGHWLAPLKQESRLAVATKKSAERFLLYDVTLKRTHSLDVSIADGGYLAVLTGETPVHDFTLFRPVGNGQWTVAQCDTVQSTSAAKTKENKPASNDDSNLGGIAEPLDSSLRTPDESVLPSPTTPATDAEVKPAEESPQPSNDAEETAALSADNEGSMIETTETLSLIIKGGLAVQNAAVKVQQNRIETTTDSTDEEATASPDASNAEPAGTRIPFITTEPVDAADAAALLTRRLQPLGLGDVELEYVSRMLHDLVLTKNSTVMVYRLDSADFEERLPLEVIPTPTRLIRVPLVVVYGIDPHVLAEVDTLIARLGDDSWKVRQSAQERLAEIGAAALPKLKQSLFHTDPEVVHRVEQLLEVLVPKEGEDTNARFDLLNEMLTTPAP